MIGDVGVGDEARHRLEHAQRPGQNEFRHMARADPPDDEQRDDGALGDQALHRSGASRRSLTTREPPVEAALDRAEQDDFGGNHENQNEDDDGEDRFGIEFLAGDVQQIADAGIAAEQFGREHDFP